MHLASNHLGSSNESDFSCNLVKIKVIIAITTLLPKITVHTINKPPDNLTKTPVAEKHKPAQIIQAIASLGESIVCSPI